MAFRTGNLVTCDGNDIVQYRVVGVHRESLDLVSVHKTDPNLRGHRYNGVSKEYCRHAKK